MNKQTRARWITEALTRLLCVVTAALAGCATTPAPVEQLKYFSQAFAAVNTVGQPLIDDLAVAERVVARRQAQLRAKGAPDDKPCSSRDATWATTGDGKLGYIDGFCLEHAGYFSTLGDPPATAQLRGGLRVIERYAEVLTTLAEGRNIEQALGEVDSLGQEVSGLVALVGAPVALVPALTALQPLLASVARSSNASEARRLIVEGAPKVSTLIGKLRDAVPPMFKYLIADPRRNADNAATAQAAVEEIEARRVVVSLYVVLLGRLQQAWEATAVAANNPGRSPLTNLVERTAQIKADAETVRRTLAALRSGTPPAP